MPVLLEEQGNISQQQSARRPARLPPSRIYTINNKSQDSFAKNVAPKTAPIGPSSSPFRHSNHSTGSISNIADNNNIIGRSRSVSTSNNGTSTSSNNHNIIGRSRSFSTGGVVPRSRADSEASRLALEALIQKRIDRITQRLDDFNFQSHELSARTQDLAKSFQDNAKRLYKVEDHLLRVQGKPGLSDAYIDNGGPTQPRRLTHDLEELRMGVKTLRKKFQAAGSVVSTVDWWMRLKDGGSKDSNGDDAAHAANEEPSLEDAAVSSSPLPSSPVSTLAASAVVSSSVAPKSFSLSSSSFSLNRTVSRKEGQALQKIMTAPDATATIYITPASTQDTISSPEPLPHGATVQGLRSPPLTPKGPPSLLGSYLAQRTQYDDYGHTTTNIKARPLSVIQDLDEPLQLPMSPPTTAWTKDDNNDSGNAPTPSSSSSSSSLPALSLADDIHFDNDKDHAIIHAQSASMFQSARQSNNNTCEVDAQSRPVFLEIFTPPSHAGTTTTTAIATVADAKEEENVVSRSSLLTEPVLEAEADFTGVEKHAGCEVEDKQVEEQQHEDELQQEYDSTLAEHISESDAIKEIGDIFVEEESIAQDTTSDSTISVEAQQQADKTMSDAVVEEIFKDDLLQDKDEPSSRGPTTATTTEEEKEQQQDTWIQTLWKILIRLEYFFLGTAVLGAMMPDSLLALCAGFLSAVLYGALVIRHRILAAPESEAPKPPSSSSSSLSSSSVGGSSSSNSFALGGGGVGVGKRRHRIR
ncbi:hypothetical protein BGZ95_009549 [Linnemannia exigua]|uniref:Uncharacterized protein n=1 Tax=Linnemannia exigua TaxID=604196 RepID=A0AAD4H6N0_9FUNG|nr:hypothetical protein BGZ95_009549 [Linnemannia exigua]